MMKILIHELYSNKVNTKLFLSFIGNVHIGDSFLKSETPLKTVCDPPPTILLYLKDDFQPVVYKTSKV